MTPLPLRMKHEKGKRHIRRQLGAVRLTWRERDAGERAFTVKP
jgi:hypothetical protein